MADFRIENENAIEDVLDKMADGFGRSKVLKATDKGANVFINTMKPMIPKSASIRKGEHVHLRDSLVKVHHADGSTEFGFTKKGAKGYIGRFQNDGWDVVDPNGTPHGHVEGKYFWESAQKLAKEKVKKVVDEEVKKNMDEVIKK